MLNYESCSFNSLPVNWTKWFVVSCGASVSLDLWKSCFGKENSKIWSVYTIQYSDFLEFEMASRPLAIAPFQEEQLGSVSEAQVC